MAERSRLDLEAQELWIEARPGGLEHASNEGTVRSIWRPSAEGSEVVLADDRIGRKAQDREVDRASHMPDRSTSQWIDPFTERDLVAVTARRRASARVEMSWRHNGAPHDDPVATQSCERPSKLRKLPARTQSGAEAALQSCSVEIDVDDLGLGVDPCVGATRTGKADVVTDGLRKCRGEHACDGPLTRLDREAVERRPVVRHAECDARLAAGRRAGTVALR